jgi:hypothetical protein
MPYGHKPIFYVGEVGPAAAVSRDIPNLGPRVSIVDHQGKLIGRFGEMPAGTEVGKFLAPHGLAVDSHGDVYVGEVSWTGWPQIFPDTPRAYPLPAKVREGRLDKERVIEAGYLGFGNMGQPVAHKLLAAGHSLLRNVASGATCDRRRHSRLDRDTPIAVARREHQTGLPALLIAKGPVTHYE